MTSSQHREKLYCLLETLLQRKLTRQEHDEVRDMLIGYVEHTRRTNPNIANHVFICQKCYGVTMGYGREFYQTVRIWNKHAYEISQQHKRKLLDAQMEDPQ